MLSFSKYYHLLKILLFVQNSNSKFIYCDQIAFRYSSKNCVRTDNCYEFYIFTEEIVPHSKKFFNGLCHHLVNVINLFLFQSDHIELLLL
jgi:hypothetical protein